MTDHALNYRWRAFKRSRIDQLELLVFVLAKKTYCKSLGRPADDAGITEPKTITSIDQLVELLQYYEPKEKINVTVAVLDGNEYKEKTLTVKLGKDDSSSKDSKDSSEDSMSQDSQDADIPDIQGGQDDSDQGDADAFADDGEASLFRDFEQNGLYD